MEDRLVVGRVVSSHGIRGEMKIRSLSGEDSHIRKLKRLWLRTETRNTGRGNAERSAAMTPSGAYKTVERKVISVRGALPNLILALEGITTPEEARKYRGAEILVERNNASPLREGEFYYSDLAGCKVCFEGRVLATVRSVWENSNCDMLEVVCDDGRIAQIPLQEQFVGDISVEERRIELKVDWILE